jgi:hypothetical protein
MALVSSSSFHWYNAYLPSSKMVNPEIQENPIRSSNRLWNHDSLSYCSCSVGCC